MVRQEGKLQGHRTFQWEMQSEGWRCGHVPGGVGEHGDPRGVEGAPLASAPRGEVTADSGPFIPRMRLSQPFFAAKDSNSSDIPHPSLISVSIWGRPPSLLTLPPQPPWGVVRAGTLCCCFDGKETKAKQTVGPRSQGSSCPPPFCFNWGLWWKESTFCCQKHRGLILVFATSWLGWVGYLGHRSSPL